MNPRLLLLTAFGIGRLQPAPGTLASALTVAWGLFILILTGGGWVVDASLLLTALVFAIACVRFGAEGETHFGRKDAGAIVADEVAGQALALIALPWRAEDWKWNLAAAATAFVAFRIFDITKPPPIRGLQRWAGGWGILADDLAAGILASVVTQLLARFILPMAMG